LIAFGEHIENLNSAMSTTGVAAAPNILRKELLGNLWELAGRKLAALYLCIHVSVIFTTSEQIA
jgi:hypothetical protein